MIVIFDSTLPGVIAIDNGSGFPHPYRIASLYPKWNDGLGTMSLHFFSEWDSQPVMPETLWSDFQYIPDNSQDQTPQVVGDYPTMVSIMGQYAFDNEVLLAEIATQVKQVGNLLSKISVYSVGGTPNVLPIINFGSIQAAVSFEAYTGLYMDVISTVDVYYNLGNSAQYFLLPAKTRTRFDGVTDSSFPVFMNVPANATIMGIIYT